MLRASSCLSSGATKIAVAASGLPSERGDSSAVGRGRADQQHCYYHVPTVNQRRLLQLLSSWWWAWGCPKHVELYLNDRQYIWAIDASGWLIYLKFCYFHFSIYLHYLHQFPLIRQIHHLLNCWLAALVDEIWNLLQCLPVFFCNITGWKLIIVLLKRWKSSNI
jgi:hypothetical protein